MTLMLTPEQAELVRRSLVVWEYARAAEDLERAVGSLPFDSQGIGATTQPRSQVRELEALIEQFGSDGPITEAVELDLSADGQDRVRGAVLQALELAGDDVHDACSADHLEIAAIQSAIGRVNVLLPLVTEFEEVT
jgi:hypothetical protein